MNRGARQAIVHGVAKSLTQRATNTFTPLSFIAHTGGAKPISKSLGPLQTSEDCARVLPLSFQFEKL